jgi:hypothetical protein
MTAPTIVAGSTSGADAGNTTSTTVTAPTNIAGDVIYIAIASDLTSQTFTGPAGFSTLYSNVDIPATSPTATFAMFYKTSGGSEPGTYSVGVGTTERQAWVAFAVRGDGGVGVTGSPNNSGTGSTAASVPFVTTPAIDYLLIAVVATDVSAGLTTPMTPTAMTKLNEASGSSAAAVCVCYEAATTAGTWPSNSGVTLNVAEQWLGVSFAIAPVAVASTISRPDVKPVMSKTLARPYLRI